MKFLFIYGCLKRAIFLAMLIVIQYGPAFAGEKLSVENPVRTIAEDVGNRISGPERIKLLNRHIGEIGNEFDCCIKKLKLKGEFNLSDKKLDKHNESKGKESFFSKILPDKIQWEIESDPKSNYFNGEMKIGKHFAVKGNYGPESGIKALLVFPF